MIKKVWNNFLVERQTEGDFSELAEDVALAWR